MKVVILVLAVIALGFAGVVAYGLARRPPPETATASGAAPPTKDGKVDEDALEDWRPPSLADAMGATLSPLAPKVRVSRSPITAAPFQSPNASAPPSKDKLRVARFHWSSGGVMRVTYACADGEDRSCPQAICLCSPGATLAEGVVSDCPEHWADRRRRGSQVVCGERDGEQSLIVYPEGGTFRFEAPGGRTTVVQP